MSEAQRKNVEKYLEQAILHYLPDGVRMRYWWEGDQLHFTLIWDGISTGDLVRKIKAELKKQKDQD